MTGYTPYNKAYVNGTTGKLIQFPAIAPIAYVIGDGDRVDDLHKDYPVLWKGNSIMTSRSSAELYDTETSHNMFSSMDLMERVVTKPSTARKPISVTKHWTGHPSTYVKALYLPTPFYWNWTANFTGMASSTPLNPYRHSSELTFLVEDEVYNVKDVQDEGICQPIRSGESVEYQWGFSFLQLFVMTVLLHSWSIGLVVLWTTARLTLKRNNIAASPEGWKSLLKMTDGIKEQLMSAGMIWENLTDKELQGEIRLLLTGGPVPISSEESHPEKTLPQGHFSLWRWMWKHKLRLLEGIFFIVFTCLENSSF
ncbi:hypothetical protein NOF04DRAFT_6165 [Fusarium oxysporum II5]|uniref:Uncharacterized protein n=1 Tax=Fusarium odoratissimum (strain NRRL 54006) TaxID=1089451 RepID=X0JBM4_FUSO5|nr:uncharacterized protein FOIG_09369 [Fusarium odoratissimum NRRL 54006]EXL98613.1 hypothetical protein FOIG_09369 [Fusarium odoratissimum NRRL 54006]KAK2129307.1 hypothetical protein NOF04DRAFT_6165 [Fusarium oxysporum II5]